MSVVKITDAQTGSHARIAVAAGFNCFEFTARSGDTEVAVIHSADGFEDGDKAPSHSGIPILFPFPNRIRAGRYTWDGKTVELPESRVKYDGSGNAIHGFCLDRPWRVLEQDESSVTGIFQISVDAEDRRELWPADAELTVRYSLKGNCLQSEFTVRNPDDVPLPWGLGTHAYFRLPLSDQEGLADKCTVYAPTNRCRQLDSYLPTGRIVDAPAGAALDQSPEFGSLKLDDAYTGLQALDGEITSRIIDPDSGWSVEQKTSADFAEMVAFTPPWTTAVCLEPYTCITDAINLHADGVDTGLQILPPGATWAGRIEVTARPKLD